MILEKLFLESTSKHRFFATYVALNIALLAVFYKYFMPQYYSPLWMPMVLVGYALLVVLISYFTKYVKKNIDYFLYPFLFVIIAWIIYLSYKNHFHSNFITPAFGAVILLGIDRFRKYYHFLFWLMLNVFLVIYAALNVAQPQSDPFIVTYIFLAAAIFTAYIEQSYLAALAKIGESRDLIYNYFNSAKALIVVLGKEGEIVNINKYALQMLGYSKDELVGENWFEKCVPQSIQVTMKQTFVTLIEEEPENLKYFENSIITKGGVEKTVRWSNTVQKNYKGNFLHVLSTGIDVTDERNNKNSVDRKNAELEKLTDMMVGRELRIAELKEKIKELQKDKI